MSFWVLVQVLVNILLFAACGLLWVRLHRPAKDDPRLSKGLQLLQSKIAVLEDLSDRTEHQVSQLTAILETKCREIQEKIVAADKQISRIDQSAQKSLEVAKIFQDRIPHSEILERQNTIKYVKAARMAHHGASIDEIVKEVELSRAEIEFIAKVNRERLQFSEEDLPEWAREEAAHAPSSVARASELKFSLPRENFESAFTVPQVQPSVAFQPVSPTATFAAQTPQQGVRAPQQAQSVPAAQSLPPVPAATPAASQQGFMEFDLSGGGGAKPANTPIKAQTSSGKSVEVRPVLFPRIEK